MLYLEFVLRVYLYKNQMYPESVICRMAPKSRLSRARKRTDRGLNGHFKRKADAISSDEPPLHEDDEGAKLTWFDILENGASKQQARGSNDSFKSRGPYSGDSNRTKRRKSLKRCMHCKCAQ